MLRGGSPDRLDRHPDIAVVGGGVVGLATAAMCVRAGLGDVLVLEGAELAGGPSGRAGGVLSPEPHAWTDPADLVELGRHSLTLTRQVDNEWDNTLGIRDLDCLLTDRDLDQVSTPLAAPFDVLDEHQVRDREPSVRGIASAVLVRGQAHVDPLRFAAGFTRHAGTVATNVTVTGATIRARTLTTLHTTIGDIHPGVVVSATGHAPTGVAVRHTAVKGHLAVTRPLAHRLRSRVVSPIGGALPLQDGRLLTGGTFDENAQPGVQQAVVDQIRRGLDELIPAAMGTAFSHVWTCHRPASPDRLPIIDRLPGTDNAWFTAGHFGTGLLMAAATGETIAAWIGTGTRPARAAPFTVARFRTQPPNVAAEDR